MPILPFISDENLHAYVERVLYIVRSKTLDENQLFKNAVDPFSAVFDAAQQNISLKDWTAQEKSRQLQKTLQNAVGEFHQRALGSMPGWEDLATGQVVDLKNDNKKVIAEVKNKYNTAKGSDRIVIYDKLLGSLVNTYHDYTAYNVEVIPHNKGIYDKPFVPSDNQTRQRRPTNDKIRVIDGKSFYRLASGFPDALRMLYEALPKVIIDILGTSSKIHPRRIVPWHF